MDKVESNGIVIYQFESLIFKDFPHGFFTRNGGVSGTPWNSLNIGGTVGDDPLNVIENRARIFKSIDRKITSIFDVWQVHGTTTICTNRPRPLDAQHQKADAIFTNNPDVTLFMRFADCVPIFIIEPEKKIVGIIHAGWKGTVDNIVRNAIQSIKRVYDIKTDQLIAGIGPSIGPDHYEIGNEIQEYVKVAFGAYSKEIIKNIDGKIFLDLWSSNEFLLREQGIQNIEKAKICTACNTDTWYSHRAEKGKTGRFGAFIAIKEGAS
ncbi:MAG: peptidoglycan editing factor PgeF [Chloroflexi bacterium]|nr:peptidoglycan editing factor PgeF [Chloroflexota bacterium]